MAPKNYYYGLNFDTLRLALFNMYLYDPTAAPPDDDPVALAAFEAYNKGLMEQFVLPMQHNFNNPLKGNEVGKDTFIEYFIVSDEHVGQDHKYQFSERPLDRYNLAYKLASVDIRFVGAQAEIWAKAFHHIHKRNDVVLIFEYFCKGEILEYAGPITPVVVDYYGVGNSSVAFDITIQIQYKEYVHLDIRPLNYVSTVEGEAIESD